MARPHGRTARPRGHPIDQVVVAFFEAPRSYTAEDVVEISCHGSPVVLRHAVERALEAGARLAEPGEFTLRAFLNGRIDLPQAEAVRDLIEATTLYQARIAAQQAGGSVSRRIAPLKEQLLELIALLEAGIDFAEDDVSVATAGEILRRLEPVLEGVRRLAASFQYGGLVRAGLTLAIVGRPNVGKSSLFNRLLEQDRAIVDGHPRHHARPGLRDRLHRRHPGEAVRHRRHPRGRGAGGIAGHRAQLPGHGGRRSDAGGDGRFAAARRGGPGADRARRAPGPLSGGGQQVRPVRDRRGRGRPECSRFPPSPAKASRDCARPFSKRWPREALSSRKPASSPACATSGCCANPPRTWKRRAPPSKPAFRTRCCCWISTPRCGPIDAITGATTADDILNRIFSTFCIGK